MVGANKILTVSYGTFSCTLEGFDDSFETMKAITEYFRDLATSDPHFGAEPMVPDTDMLQRIAELQAKQHVDAHLEDNTVVLRAGETLTEPEPTAAPPQTSVAERLAQIRAAGDAAQVDTLSEVDSSFLPESTDRGAEPAPAADPDTSIESETSTPQESNAEQSVFETTTTRPAETIADGPYMEPGLDIMAPDEEDEDIDLSELLPDYGAPQQAFTTPDEEQDEQAPAAKAEESRHSDADDDKALMAVSQNLQGDEQDLGPEDDMDVTPPAVGLEILADDLILEAPAPERKTPEPPAPNMLKLVGTERPDDEDIQSDRQTETETTHRALKRARARVMNFKLPSDEIDRVEYSSNTGEDVRIDPIPLAPLPETDGNAASEEVAVTRSSDDTPKPESIPTKEEVRPPETPHALGSNSPAEDEEAVSRLLEETNNKLAGPEHRRRRSAIAHLKAAVAATVAERRLTPTSKTATPNTQTPEDPYRQDLAEVVNPRDDTTSETGSSAMTPLMLVTEQRVDLMTDANGAQGHPHRASKGNLALQEDPVAAPLDLAADLGDMIPDLESFTTYLASMGLSDPTDIMEAAGRYLILSGESEFTRAMVMRTVSEQLGEESFPREEGLRAFGTLLREGKFERIRRGRFTISQS